LPRVAVCVPAFDEVDGVAAVVRAIHDSTYPADRLRTVVAVDGADPAVVAAARAAGAEVVEVVPNQGSYAARNAAVAAVGDTADVVLFTDADCRIPSGGVRAHVDALARAGADLTGGAVRFTFAGPTPTPAEWVDSIRHLQQELYVSRDGYAATCNLGVRRTVLDALRFDATLRTGGDAEFCRRATAAGFHLAYAPEAWIDHPARPTRHALLAKVRRIAGGVARHRARWEERTVTLPRPTRGPYRRARQAGHDVGPWWGLRASLLDYRCNRIVVTAVRRMLATPEPDDRNHTEATTRATAGAVR
jgi:glycosyltransferase involved in cell wall biosynthesis